MKFFILFKAHLAGSSDIAPSGKRGASYFQVWALLTATEDLLVGAGGVGVLGPHLRPPLMPPWLGGVVTAPYRGSDTRAGRGGWGRERWPTARSPLTPPHQGGKGRLAAAGWRCRSSSLLPHRPPGGVRPVPSWLGSKSRSPLGLRHTPWPGASGCLGSPGWPLPSGRAVSSPAGQSLPWSLEGLSLAFFCPLAFPSCWVLQPQT